MKNLLAISKKGIILVSAVFITIAGLMLAVLPSIYAPSVYACSGDGGTGGDGSRNGYCGGLHEAGPDSGYVKIPILNNHYPKKVTISKVEISVPGGECYSQSQGMGKMMMIHWYNTKIVKQIKFGDTVVFSDDNGLCTCAKHPVNFTFNQNGGKYEFSTPKVVCRVKLDWAPVPSGTYTVTYYFTIEGVSGEKSNTVTFSL